MDDAINPVEMIFNEAVRQPGPAERAAYLASACGTDARLRARVDALLRAHDAAGSFLASPPPSPAGASGGSSDPSFAATIDAGPGADAVSATRRRGSAAAESITETPGTCIGHYKLLQQIGEGGFGTVWMADQEKPVRRRVALKIIKAGMDTKEVIARFEQERQALAMMDHPNIARVLDAGATDTGRPYFVMELVRGVKITEYCDEQGLSTAERIDLFITVCQAVQHAHQKGIIHRDLKPSNILVTINDGEAVPKVIDFGVAKATQGRITDGTLFTRFEQMIGTPLYMSPEQAEITSLDVDTRSDIYALGVLLYELLTGSTPIDTNTMARAGMDEIRRLIREVDPPRPSVRLKTLNGNEITTVAKRRHMEVTKLSGSLRGDLDWIVMKCLEKDRKRRYDTANGLALDLQRHLKHEVVVARPPTTGYLLSKLIRRNKLAFAASIAIAASLVIGIAASVWQAVRATDAETKAVAAFDELRATAPAFAEQARALAAREKFDEAIEKLDYALKLRPDVAEYLVAKADLLQCQLKLAEAAQVYRQALTLKPNLARAEASAKLCDELLAAPVGSDGKLTRESLAKLHVEMQKQQRPAAEIMPVARLLGEEKKLIVDYWLARLKDLPVSTERPLKDRLTVRDDGRLALDLRGTKVVDLSPLAGAPLGELNLSSCEDLTDLSPLRGLDLIELNISATNVADLSPLREMHTLEKLEMYGCKVTDLSPLSALRLRKLNFMSCAVSDLDPIRRMPLEELTIRYTRVADLTPLVGMPIRAIDLTGSPVLDFSPLAQLPLERCYMQHNRITDLSVLRGKPLKELVIWGCVDARNYAVLSEIKTLELLLLPSQYRGLPDEDYAAIGALRDHPRLRQIGSEIMNQMGYAATGPKELFWQTWDRERAFVPALRRSGLTFSLQKLATGTYHLSFNQQPLSDISFLKGAPISQLELIGCRVTDLTPLSGMPLESLHLEGNPVSDLGPLRETKIRTLILRYTKVRDLSPLAGLPLKTLFVDSCPEVTDVAPLAAIHTLEQVSVPPHAAHITALRALPQLQRLGFSITPLANGPWVPTDAAAEFWKDYDANPWIARLNETGIRARSIKRADGGTWEVDLNESDISDLSLFKDARISALNLRKTAVTDLSPLRGMPLKSLNIDETKTADLGPLKGMPLEWLGLYGTEVSDLSPLRGMPLKALYAGRSRVTDLEPLRGMPLQILQVFALSIADLSPLKGMPLRELWLGHYKGDLSALRGMPLTWLKVHDCPAGTDVSPLADLRELRTLTVPEGAEKLGSLRGLPKIERISFREDWGNGGRPDKTAAEFWKDYDRSAWVQKLRDSGVAIKSARELPDGTWFLDISDSSITELTFLKGVPISSLALDRTAITDLSPLKGMPLKKLWLSDCRVSDLSPLKGLPLEFILINSLPVTDFSPLGALPLTDLRMVACANLRDISFVRGMHLKSLRLQECPELADLSPLADMKTLVDITLPPAAKDIEFLRRLPKLERIAFKDDAKNDWRPVMSAAEFWKEHDDWPRITKAVEAAGFTIKSLELQEGGIWHLDLADSQVGDLKALRELPIVSLSLGSTEIADLEPLRGMKLKTLYLYNTKIKDLSPLKDMPLDYLHISGTGVSDISILRGMPLTALRFHDCPDLTDLSPLAECKTLTNLTLPPNAKGFEFLRAFPKIQRIAYSEDQANGYRVAQTAAEFWQEFDAKK